VTDLNVGGQDLGINPLQFGESILDSGTTMLYLQTGVYNALLDKVRSSFLTVTLM
jgi:hypothetical protein